MSAAAYFLAKNLEALMRDSAFKTQKAVAELTGVDQRTVGRVLKQANSPTLDVVDGLARGFKVDAWRLVAPNLGTPQTFNELNGEEAHLLDLFRRIKDPEKRHQAAVDVNNLGNEDGEKPTAANPFPLAPPPGAVPVAGKGRTVGAKHKSSR